jgi:hypothetical protein
MAVVRMHNQSIHLPYQSIDALFENCLGVAAAAYLIDAFIITVLEASPYIFAGVVHVILGLAD